MNGPALVINRVRKLLQLLLRCSSIFYYFHVHFNCNPIVLILKQRLTVLIRFLVRFFFNFSKKSQKDMQMFVLATEAVN